MYVGNNAYLSYTMRLFRRINGVIQHWWGPNNQDTEALELKGILTFIYTVEHELAHKCQYESGLVSPYLSQEEDQDQDCVLDLWERLLGLDPNDTDTTDAYGGDRIGDAQCVADIAAYGRLLEKRELWKKDWADTGLQKGPPPFNPMPWRHFSTGTNVSKYDDLLTTLH